MQCEEHSGLSLPCRAVRGAASGAPRHEYDEFAEEDEYEEDYFDEDDEDDFGGYDEFGEEYDGVW